MSEPIVETPAGGTPPAPPAPPAGAPPAAAAPPPAIGQPVVDPPASSVPDPMNPDKDGFIKLRPEHFKKRVGKATRKELREWGKELGLEFKSGTSSDTMREALKARQADYLRLKQQEADQQREQMTERQKWEADKEAAERRARHAERRMIRAREKVSVQRWDRRIGRIAGDLVAAEQVPEVVKILKSELRGDRKLLKRLNPKRSHGERRLREWFENKVRTVPSFAKAGSAPADPGGAPPIQNGASAAPQGGPLSHGAPPAPSRVNPQREAYNEDVVQRMFPGKTIAHGQPNSLTSEEVRQVQRALVNGPPPPGVRQAGPQIPPSPRFPPQA